MTFSEWLQECRDLKGRVLNPRHSDVVAVWLEAYWDGLDPQEAIDKIDPQPFQDKN